MFNMANHRVQLIITGDLPANVMQQYKDARLKFPNQYFTLGNANKDTLTKMLAAEKFDAVIDKGLPPSDGTHFITDFKLTNIKVVVTRPLDSKALDTTYPEVGMPFYLYGHSDSEYHIDHILLAAPNAQFTADKVTIDMNSGSALPTLPFCQKIIVNLPERVMQPFPSNKDIAADSKFFFRRGVVLPFAFQDAPLVKGKLTLTNNVFVDTDMLNEDPVPPKQDGMQGMQGGHSHTRMARMARTTQAPHGSHLLNAEQGIVRGREWQDIIDSFPRPYDV